MTTSTINSINTNPIFNFIINASQTVRTNAIPFVQSIITKVQAAWQSMRPFLEIGAKALSTRMGTGIICLTSALGFYGHANMTEDTNTKITSIVIGTLGLLAGTYLLATQAIS